MKSRIKRGKLQINKEKVMKYIYRCSLMHFFILVICLILVDSSLSETKKLKLETKIINGVSYTLYILQPGQKIRFSESRPKNGDEFLLFVAGTFTDKYGDVQGLYGIDGSSKVDIKDKMKWSGLAIISPDGKLTIENTKAGSKFTKEKLNQLIDLKSSWMQCFILVDDGKVIDDYRPQRPFQRRALALLQDSSIAIIESSIALDDLNQFGKDLKDLGVKSAVNLDMGTYDKGAYKNPSNGKIQLLGHLQNYANNDNVSNYVIFK